MTLLHPYFLRPALLLLLCWLVGLPAAQAQQGRKPRTVKTRPSGRSKSAAQKDFFRIKTPTIHYVQPDTTTVVETEELPDDNSDAAKAEPFNPKRELSIVSEDTTSLDEGEQQIVEMKEEVLIDSSWIQVAGYYAIWDTHSINPYHSDGRRLKDTLNIKLVEPERERFGKMPLVRTPITSGFGFRGYRWHYGVDLDLETGDSVKTVFDGVVRINQYDGGGYGNYIVVRHYNGLETLYGHMSKALLKPGTFVKAGELIGYGGSTGRSTGSHLHFEVRYEGNPLNPLEVYDFPDYKLRQDNFTITSALFAYYDRALRAKQRAAAAPSRARRSVIHTVRRGDTLSGIAHKYGVSVSSLQRLNSRTRVLQPGQKLRIK